jgi:hypothetical protein
MILARSHGDEMKSDNLVAAADSPDFERDALH